MSVKKIGIRSKAENEVINYRKSTQSKQISLSNKVSSNGKKRTPKKLLQEEGGGGGGGGAPAWGAGTRYLLDVIPVDST